MGDHCLSEIFKGSLEEVNNSIIDTYPLHVQKYDLVIDKRMDRDVDLKIARCLRILLSFLSKTEHRKEIKKMLKSTIQEQYDFLRSFDLSLIDNLGSKPVSLEDYFKTMAFQLGQTTSLIQGKELYSKESIAQEYPQLSPLLMRENIEEKGIVIESFKKLFLDSFDPSLLKYEKEPLFKK